MTTRNRIRLGMVGGGQGSLIGGVHRYAARLDDRYELVAGVFSSDARVNERSAAELRVAPERCYADVEALVAGESGRDDGVQVVAIVTPNFLHFEAAQACIEAGFHLVCEKPMTVTGEQARTLAERVAARGVQFVVAHAYAGYPMVQHAHDMVHRGLLGEVRSVQVEYAQEWLSDTPAADNKQADWRLDPARAGLAGCLGDIGTHAYQLASFVSGLTLDAVSADLSAMVPGRQLDDNVHAMLRFNGGAKGMLWASQTAPGFENGLRLRVIGEKASLAWGQESPNELWYAPLNEPRQRITRRDDWVNPDTARSMRVPGGHPEGYLEAFANLYQALADRLDGMPGENTPAAAASKWLPGVHAGVDGLNFITAVLASSQADSAWVRLAESQLPVGRLPDGAGGRP